MEFLLVIPLLFIFLYSLYRLIKDDYVFIRRNISLENAFDIAFLVIIIGLLISRFFYLLFHFETGKNIFLLFFTAQNAGFSLTGAVIGGLVGIYLIGKYKKAPLGRFFDFFTLSFLVTLPIWFLIHALFIKPSELLLHFITFGLYLILALVFVRYLYPKLISRTVKEGYLSILFLLSFSLISLLVSLLASFPKLITFVTIQNGVLIALFIFSIVLLVRHDRGGKRRVK